MRLFLVNTKRSTHKVFVYSNKFFVLFYSEFLEEPIRP